MRQSSPARWPTSSTRPSCLPRSVKRSAARSSAGRSEGLVDRLRHGEMQKARGQLAAALPAIVELAGELVGIDGRGPAGGIGRAA
jgi:hypothetical protein